MYNVNSLSPHQFGQVQEFRKVENRISGLRNIEKSRRHDQDFGGVAHLRSDDWSSQNAFQYMGMVFPEKALDFGLANPMRRHSAIMPVPSSSLDKVFRTRSASVALPGFHQRLAEVKDNERPLPNSSQGAASTIPLMELSPSSNQPSLVGEHHPVYTPLGRHLSTNPDVDHLEPANQAFKYLICHMMVQSL